MSDKMTFPETWEDFEKSYGFTDSEEIYTNGSRLIPSSRVKQWLDHEESKRKTKQQATVSRDCIIRQDAKDAVDMALDTIDHVPEWVYDILLNSLDKVPSAEPKIIHCKDCRNRGEDECPMRHVERIEWEEDGYIEVDDIVHDYTEPYGYCDKGERNE